MNFTSRPPGSAVRRSEVDGVAGGGGRQDRQRGAMADVVLDRGQGEAIQRLVAWRRLGARIWPGAGRRGGAGGVSREAGRAARCSRQVEHAIGAGGVKTTRAPGVARRRRYASRVAGSDFLVRDRTGRVDGEIEARGIGERAATRADGCATSRGQRFASRQHGANHGAQVVAACVGSHDDLRGACRCRGTRRADRLTGLVGIRRGCPVRRLY